MWQGDLWISTIWQHLKHFRDNNINSAYAFKIEKNNDFLFIIFVLFSMTNVIVRMNLLIMNEFSNLEISFILFGTLVGLVLSYQKAFLLERNASSPAHQLTTTIRAARAGGAYQWEHFGWPVKPLRCQWGY